MRSLLFVPAHDARKLAKGLGCGADALIVDLEDAVPAAEKGRARGMCAEFVGANRAELPIFVRINALSTGLALDDLQAVVHARPHGIVLPKCESGRDVAALAGQLTRIEASNGVAAGSLRILSIVTESAASLFGLHSYSTPTDPRLCAMMWGGEDLAADIGAAANRDADGRYTGPYELARSLTLLGATAAHVAAVDAVYTNFRDTEGLKAEAVQAVRDGFSAKAAIHPDQIGTIHEVFTPSSADVAWAQTVIEAFDAAPQSGAIAIDGKMLDRPHYRSAQRVLARASTHQSS